MRGPAKPGLVAAFVLVCCAFGAAGDDDPLQPTIKRLRKALRDGNYVAATECFATFEKLRWSYDDEDRELQTMAKTVGAAARHKDTSIAIAAAKCLGQLRVPDSGWHLSGLLAVPPEVPAGSIKLHLAAIEAAGAIRDRSTLSKLERLIDHRDTEIAVAACAALGQYAAADRKTRLDLIGRVNSVLARLEKRNPPNAEERIRVTVTTRAVLECLLALTRNPDLQNSAQVRKWLRAERKREDDPT